MIENYDDFEAMFDRALEIATIKSNIWGDQYDLDSVRHDGDYITVIGTDYCDEYATVDFPVSYMNINNDEIQTIEGLRKVDWDAEQIRIQAEEKERGLYVQLTNNLEQVMDDK